MRGFITLLLVGLVGFATGCSTTRSVKCIEVDGKNVCFVRTRWGLNGDQVIVTMSTNPCREPNAKQDYVSDQMGAGEFVFYKIVENRLVIYGSPYFMLKPLEPFPVPVEFEDDNSNPSEERLKEKGFTRLNLDDPTHNYCLRDYL